MRGLQTRDLFTALKIVKKAGVSEEIKRVGLLAQSGEMDVKELGIELIFTVFENSTNAEKEIYQLVSSLLEVDEKAVETMDPLELIEQLKGLKDYMDMEQVKSFLSSLSKLMK